MMTGEERLYDYQQLKQLLVGLWSLLTVDAVTWLRDGVQQFVCWQVPETAEPAQLLEPLERAGLLSQNTVSILAQLCALVDCGGGARLVQKFEDKYPQISKAEKQSSRCETRPWVAQAGPQPDSQPRPSDARGLESQPDWTEGFQPAWDQQNRVNGGLDMRPGSAPPEEYAPHDCTIGDTEFSELNWSRTEPSVGDWMIGDTGTGTPLSACEWPRAEAGPAVWPPLESAQPPSPETEQGRRESMAVWGHIRASPTPRRSPSPPRAVCECLLPHRPAAPRPHKPAGVAHTVQQVLDWRPAAAAAGGGGIGTTGVTPAGERRARLVDFLSRRLGGRYLQLGPQLECITSSELAALSSDTSSDLVSTARRLLHLFLSRHGAGDVEQALSRRLRKALCTRLADELDIWSEQQDRLEDDWDRQQARLENNRSRERLEGSRGRRRDHHDHPPPLQVPRMACC